MEGDILAPGAVTRPMQPQATAAPFEERAKQRLFHDGTSAAGSSMRATGRCGAWRKRDAVPRTDVEPRAMARAPLCTRSDLRVRPVPPVSRSPDGRQETGLAWARVGMDTAVLASARRRKDGAALGCAGTPAAMPRSGPAPCFPLVWLGGRWPGLHRSSACPPQFPTADGSGR